MQYHYFQLSATNPDHTALNQLLGQSRVSAVRQEFVADGHNSFWAVCVAVIGDEAKPASASPSKRPSVDYRELLEPEVFERFAKLRELRKSISSSEGKPVYAIFNNEQLAQMAQLGSPSLKDLRAIDGVGEKRIGAYGKVFVSLLEQLNATQPEA